jgi:hypothetical protein
MAPRRRKLTAVVAEGDHRASLEALRDALAAGMEAADPNVIPQFAARLQAVLAELASLPSREESEVDELVKRRQARRAATNAGVRAKQRRRTEQRT